MPFLLSTHSPQLIYGFTRASWNWKGRILSQALSPGEPASLVNSTDDKRDVLDKYLVTDFFLSSERSQEPSLFLIGFSFIFLLEDLVIKKRTSYTVPRMLFSNLLLSLTSFSLYYFHPQGF